VSRSRVSRRSRSRGHAISHRESVAARRHAQEVTARRYASQCRAPHASKDPSLTGPMVIKTKLVRRVIEIVDHDPELVGWVEQLLEEHRSERRGRPREVEIRTALICFLLHTVVYQHFHLVHLPELVGAMSWRVRRALGIDRNHNGTWTQVSYDQLLRVFHQLADMFDAWSPALSAVPDDDGVVSAEALVAEQVERDRRAANLQEFTDRLLAGSLGRAPMGSGNVVLDATLKWCHERPKGSLNGKIERRGADGDAGSALPLSAVVGADGDVDHKVFASVAPFDVVRAHGGGSGESSTRAPGGETTGGGSAAPGEVAADPGDADDRDDDGDGDDDGDDDVVDARERVPRRKHRPSTWGLGSAWVGRTNKKKSVYGIALHAVVRSDGPCVVESFAVTPANGDPAEAVMPLLRRLHDRRADDVEVADAALAGDVSLLGLVAADGGYSGATADRWQLPIKALGGTPVFRLHRNNQEGLRWHSVGAGKRVGKVLTLGGRPVCECVAHTPLADVRFPKFPYNTSQLRSYQREIKLLDRFEWRPNEAVRSNGSQQWLAPHRHGPDGHTGGCEHCVNPDGMARVDEFGHPLVRCCETPSRLLPKEVLALEQGVRFGSEEWYARYNPRNRVEGSFGVFKNLALTNWGRDYHRFVGLSRESLVAVFALCAHNMHMLRSWDAKTGSATAGDFDGGDPTGGPGGAPGSDVDDKLPSAQPTATRPTAIRPEATDVLSSGGAPPGGPGPSVEVRSSKGRAGPKGLEHLGSSL
jgi:hypothetical protein